MSDAVITRDWEDQSFAAGAEPGNWLLCPLYIDGYALHLQAIRVKDEVELEDSYGEPMSTVQQAYDDALDGTLDEVFDLYEGRFSTTTIPGYEGDFILYAHPYGD